MPAPRGQQQSRDSVSVLPGDILGGPPRFRRGNFILAPLDIVLTDEFWRVHGSEIGMIVNCIGVRSGKGHVQYPKGAAKASVYYVDAHNDSLATDFNWTCPEVKRQLESGRDVLVHCRETFHRGPAVWAGYQVRVCQHRDYQAFYS